ncbi:MAG: hypothetical protein AABY22_09020, partial [Nanoarchaeota archaeon]
PMLQKNEEVAKLYEQQAQNVTDPQKKKALLQQANKIRQGISQEASDISKSFSPDVKQDVVSRSLGAASEIAGIASLPGILKGTIKVSNKILHPFRSVGEVRVAALAQSQGKTISGNKIITGLEKAVKTLSPADQKGYSSFLETAKQVYKGKNLSLEDILKINHEANKAYTAAGVAGKSAKAAFNETLGKILKKELALTAPKVAKANKLFSLLYGAKGVAKRVVNPLTIGAGAAGAVGSGIIGKILFGR